MLLHVRTPLALVLAASLVAGCATSPAVPVPADTPAALAPGPGEAPFLRLRGTGAQVYECVAKADAPDAWGWQFKNPEATLTDASGTVVGRHFAGPSWASNDGTTIVGQAAASVPAPKAGAIPWLLLAVKSRSGDGALAATTHVQRLDTDGGVAPGSACGAANAHQVERVGYMATYVFWRAATAADR